MVNAGIVGICGRMGSTIARVIASAAGIELVGALEAEGHPMLAQDAGVAAGIKPAGIRIESDMEKAFVASDVIIDFTFPETSIRFAEYASKNGKAIVIGSTGFSSAQLEVIKQYSTKAPIVMAPNMSIGVNVLLKVLKDITRMLGDEYDIEIVEAHHKHKKDAPSGTAKALALAVADARGVKLEDKARYERYGITGERPAGEIGLQTVRAGDIVGDHTVYFAGPGERIEVVHRAHSRENFANGAVKAALWVAGKKPGLYSMLDVLGIDK